jgi:hypothetical protein
MERPGENSTTKVMEHAMTLEGAAVADGMVASRDERTTTSRAMA